MIAYLLKKNQATLVSILIVIFFTGCKQKEVPVSEGPNILFILSDDHTSQAWGVYGGILQDIVHTPNISRLAEEGVLLNNCFATNSICTPSRASILTGQYSHRNGVYTLADPLPQKYDNIARSLKESGYQTAVVGKWHLKKQPGGFDYFNVLPGQGRYWDPYLKTEDNWKDGNKGGLKHKGFSTDVITGLSIDWLKSRDKKKPFLLMCQFKATHEPFDFPGRFSSLLDGVAIPEPENLYASDSGPGTRTFPGQELEKLRDRYLRASNRASSNKRYPELPFAVDGLNLKEQRKKTYQKLVKDFIRGGAAIDDNIGKLLNYLEAEGIANDTIVIYTADQGYFLGEHGFFDKRMIYEESMRMPFVIRYPKELNGGQRIDDIILNIDFAALLADYAGIEKPDYVDGHSFRDNLDGATPSDWRQSMYYRYWQHLADRPAHFGIRNHRYKLAFFYGHPLGATSSEEEATVPTWEFYDLREDPKENRNAYADPSYSDTIAEMKNELMRLRSELGDTDETNPAMRKIFAEHW